MRRRDPKRAQAGVEFYAGVSDRLRGDHWQPDADVFETDAAIVVRVELAGVCREDLRITVDQNVLRIRGVRESAGQGVLRLHQMEIASGPFERRLRLPVDVDPDRVSARLEQGLLTVTLARREPMRRSVAVEREGS